MSTTERIEKYLEDAEKLICLNNDSKVAAELTKLRSWLQKHQYDTVPDGAKTKLLQVLTLYYKYYQQLSVERRGVFSEKLLELFSDYLQLPEGKLLSLKDKKKVLKWQTSFTIGAPGDIPESVYEVEVFLVQDVNETERSVTVQSISDETKWLEDVKVDTEKLWVPILESFQAGVEVAVLVSEELPVKVLRLHCINP